MACESFCYLCNLYPWLCILGAFVVFFPVIFIVCAYLNSFFESKPKNVERKRKPGDYTATGSYSKTELLKSRLQRFDLSEEEIELLFGKYWRTTPDVPDLFYKIIQMKLDLTKQSKSFRKKVSHIIDKVIRMIESVYNEDPEYAKYNEKLCEEELGKEGADYLKEAWEFFKIHKRSPWDFSFIINTLDASEAYKILGLAVTATIKEVKKKYRELVLKWHPDRNRTNKIQAEKELVKINQAYETIMAAA